MAIGAKQVKTWLASTSGGGLVVQPDDEELLEMVLDAVVAHTERYYTKPEDEAADWDLATLMLTAKLWQRRQTPNGVEGAGEFGLVGVRRNDPDVEMLFSPFYVPGCA